MTNIIHEFLPGQALLRRAIVPYLDWIEAALGVPLAEAAILEVELDFAQIGVEKILGISQQEYPSGWAARRLDPSVLSAEVPPGIAPLLEHTECFSGTSLASVLDRQGANHNFDLSWKDCPVALRLASVSATVIALNASWHAGPSSDSAEVSHLLITRRRCAAEVVRTVEQLDRRDSQPRLHVLHGSERAVPDCDWEQLVLDEGAVSLLRNDFESFFEREAWFREKKLPFRRGYLLHGPPGNGKTTAIRAMMSSRGLSGYTMRLFDRDTDDRTLERLFDMALNNRPALVILEDLDRAFPKTGESRSKVSVQQLLNCLDGVATGEGVIVVATANEPTLLDPAILRRPGRFDRVVHFPNPVAELRQKYFGQMAPGFSAKNLKELAAKSGGLSFAQLREAYIMAGQLSFEAKGEITPENVAAGIASLRQSMLAGVKRSTAAGFRNSSAGEVAV